ncbi:hypothetical protein C8J56DRAFT_969675 [Mycena floridula]|nr:hypothetical protein C8J56DRAFT_969675 [Mycena floridula]
MSSNLTPVRIDDTLGDPVTGAQIIYSPADAWVAGQTCGDTVCKSKPDASQIYKSTWHGSDIFGNGLLTASVNFTGTSVSVYGVLDHVRSTQLSFSVDEQTGHFWRPAATNATEYEYNFLFYSSGPLEPQTHHLLIQNDQGFVALDYILYT